MPWGQCVNCVCYCGPLFIGHGAHLLFEHQLLQQSPSCWQRYPSNRQSGWPAIFFTSCVLKFGSLAIPTLGAKIAAINKVCNSFFCMICLLLLLNTVKLVLITGSAAGGTTFSIAEGAAYPPPMIPTSNYRPSCGGLVPFTR